MSEGLPKPEREPKITREQAVEALRFGYLLPLTKYLDQRETEGKNAHDTLLLNIEWAEIYRDAGFIDEAREAFEAAAEQAFQEHEDDLYERILTEIKRLG